MTYWCSKWKHIRVINEYDCRLHAERRILIKQHVSVKLGRQNQGIGTNQQLVELPSAVHLTRPVCNEVSSTRPNYRYILDPLLSQSSHPAELFRICYKTIPLFDELY
jgi:hypothetical protein